VTRQIEHAKVYAQRKGWVVADEHVYVDDGISGAEFANRPGFLRLMNALKPRPPFQVLIMSEESRLGREAIGLGVIARVLCCGCGCRTDMTVRIGKSDSSVSVEFPTRPRVH